MRHVIVVVGSKEQRAEPPPNAVLRNKEPVRTTTWYAGTRGEDSTQLLDDIGIVIVRWMLAPLLMYRFYSLVHNTKLWSGKRPLVLVRGRSLAARVAAYAGNWGGGDVAMVAGADCEPFGPTRFLLDSEGRLQLRE